jgi:hypothetical protein
MRIRTGLALVMVAVASAPLLRAHHAIGAVYDTNRPQTIQGSIREFHFVNPHPWIVVDVAGTAGAAEAWHLEMDNRSELAGVGMTAETLKPGDRVMVVGSRSRTQERSLYVRSLERASDGFKYEQVGSRPRVTRRGAS